MHWTVRVFFPFAFKKGRKHWGYLWVSNSIGMLMLITRVGLILMEPTEFPLALKGQARNFSINRDSSSGQPQPKPGNLNAPKRFHSRDMGILMSNSIDWYKLTTTVTTRVCPWKTIRNYFSMSPVFSNVFLLSIKFL